MEFLGRTDTQVKFHGYRVELEEVRLALNRFPQVRDSIVSIGTDPHRKQVMIAYYVAKRPIEAKVLREFLQRTLMSPILPNYFVHLKKIPLTLNGKVNHRDLPSLDQLKESSTDHAQASTETEEILGGIWAPVLGMENVAQHDNFFELGGHSLTAVQVISRVREAFRVELPLSTLFEHPTLATLSTEIEKRMSEQEGTFLPQMTAASREKHLPLSCAQERMWFVHQLFPDRPSHNVAAAFRIIGELNLSALEGSLNDLYRRHEVLRTHFEVVGDSPVQVIDAAGVGIKLHIEEIESSLVIETVNQETQRPVSLQRGALFRVRLLRVHAQEHVLILGLHHIIADGWSMEPLYREIASGYEARLRGEDPALPELAFQYADYAVWERELLQGAAFQPHLEYWKKQLHAAPDLLILPIQKARPSVQSHRGDCVEFKLSAELTDRLKKLGRMQGCSAYMTLLAMFQLLLARYSGSTDIVVGSPVANRNHGQLENLIGPFVNTLAMRTDLNGDPSVTELLQRVREVTLEAYLHQAVPFDLLVRELRPERSLSYDPVVQVVMSLHRTPCEILRLSGLCVEPVPLQTRTSKFDLLLQVWDHGETLYGIWEYSTDLFERSSIQRMARHFEQLIRSATDNPNAHISELALLSAEERSFLKLKERADTHCWLHA